MMHLLTFCAGAVFGILILCAISLVSISGQISREEEKMNDKEGADK